MNKNVYGKTEVVFKMTWVRKNKQPPPPTPEHLGTKRLKTIVKINENVSIKILPKALLIGLGRICVWLSLRMPKTIKSCKMTWYVYNMNALLLLVICIVSSTLLFPFEKRILVMSSQYPYRTSNEIYLQYMYI